MTSSPDSKQQHPPRYFTDMEHRYRHRHGTRGPCLQSVLPYPWDYVTQEYHQRFPRNPNFPYILDTQITQDEKREDGHHITRVVTLDPEMPSWLKKLTGVETLIMKEKSVTNRKTRTMTLYTENVTLSELAHMWEDCVYTEHHENNNWTFKEQIPFLDLAYCRKNSCLGLRSQIEQFCCNLFVSRAESALETERKILNNKFNGT
eukprot:gb/GECH01007096.1/.p1 GENE.gb/GECH01007096.1/~~gb/GECH01007096.1/.p1  ORF type:complete len:204 (+),score=47.58 gb/GECH01007096.1/:1-612(+)